MNPENRAISHVVFCGLFFTAKLLTPGMNTIRTY